MLENVLLCSVIIMQCSVINNCLFVLRYCFGDYYFACVFIPNVLLCICRCINRFFAVNCVRKYICLKCGTSMCNVFVQRL